MCFGHAWVWLGHITMMMMMHILGYQLILIQNDHQVEYQFFQYIFSIIVGI